MISARLGVCGSRIFKYSRIEVSRVFLRQFQHTTLLSNMRTEQEWRAILSPEQFRVLRQLGTELPYSGEYVNTPAQDGFFVCVGCLQPLYKADTKFPAHCGWPAFYEALPGAITTKEDRSEGRVRTEMRCSKCDGHLGHIFKGEGYNTPTDERHCVNSVCIKLTK